MTTLRPDRPLRSFVFMFLSGLSFCLMLIFVKRLHTQIPQFELVFFRAFINLVVVVIIMLMRREKFNIPGKRLLIFRGLAGFTGLSCLFYTASRLPLSVASMLNWTSPIFILLISRFLLKEQVSARSFVWVSIAMSGLVFLLNPPFLHSHEAMEALPLVPILVGLFGGAAGACAFMAVRALTARVGVNGIIFYFTLVASVVSLPLALVDFRIPNASQAIELLLIGGFAAAGQFAMTEAYRWAPAGVVSVMSLQNAAISALFGYLLFAET